jgi:hypothetical protein
VGGRQGEGGPWASRRVGRGDAARSDILQRARATWRDEPGAHRGVVLGLKLATCASMSDSNESDSVDLGSLTQLRDEIRVRVHLAQLDAKEKWEELETKFASLEHKVTSEGGSVIGATAQLAKELKQSFVDFRQRLAS